MIGKPLGFFRGEFIRGKLWRQVDVRYFPGVGVCDLEEGAIATNPKTDCGGDFQGVQSTGIDFFCGGDCYLFETSVVVIAKVEAVQPLAALVFPARNAIQVFFKLRGEVIIHQVGKPLLQQAGHREGDPLRHECVSSAHHITAVNDDGDDGGIRGWATNALFFQRFHEACLGETRWRLGLVSFGTHPADRESLTHANSGQHCVIG